MYQFNLRTNPNELDAEIDEFGDLTLLNVGTESVKFEFKKRKSAKVIDRKKFNRTGIPQLGTTYPNSYDREEFIKLSKNPFPFYKKSWFTKVITIIVILIDFFCYILMLDGISAGDVTVPIVALGIALAIDGLPLFIAHNLHRQCVNRKKVLKVFNILSSVFILIFLAVALFCRIYNALIAPSTNEDIADTNNFSVAHSVVESVFYALIPISTSFLCFIVNYLGYNPIGDKILKKRREILFKLEDVNELNALIVEINQRGDYERFLLDKDDEMYNAAYDMIDDIANYYKAYVRTKIMEKLQSPADTTELSVL